MDERPFLTKLAYSKLQICKEKQKVDVRVLHSEIDPEVIAFNHRGNFPLKTALS